MGLQKYFIAIVAPEPIQTQLMAFKELVKERYNSKGALRSPAHITLHMPFEWKEEKENILVNILEQFSFKETFDIELKNFSSFGQRVIFVDVVKNEMLIQLQNEFVNYIKKNLRLFNQSNDMRSFHPHVTIAFRDLKKEKFILAFDFFKTQIYTSSFNTTSFFLLKHTGKEWLVHKEVVFS